MLKEYSEYEWIQIGIFLVGLPVAAVLGAMVGLVGKWKRGYVTNAAVYGLAGSATAAGLILISFIMSRLIDFPFTVTSWVRFFDADLSIRFTGLVVVLAAGVALAEAVYLRRRESKESATSISLRQLVLAQLFVLVVLGCWTGMRSFSYEWASVFEKAQYKWAKRGWAVKGLTVSTGRVRMERAYDPASADWKAESQMLREVCEEPWLGELHLINLDNADELDFGAIAAAKELELLSLRYHPTTIPPQSHLDTIGTLAALKELNMIGGTYTDLDVTVLARTPKLKKLVLHQFNCDQARLRETIRGMKLEYFANYPHTPSAGVGTVTYWQNYHTITFYKWPIRAEELTWVDPKVIWRLQLGGSELSLEAAQAIAKMSNLDDLNIGCRIEGAALFEIAKCPNLKHLFCLQLEQPQDRASFDKAVDELLLAPKLKCIDWNWGVMKPDLDYPKPSEQELNLQKLGQPPPPMFNRAPTPEQTAFVEKINAEREKRGLGKIVINPTDQIRHQVLTE